MYDVVNVKVYTNKNLKFIFKKFIFILKFFEANGDFIPLQKKNKNTAAQPSKSKCKLAIPKYFSFFTLWTSESYLST